MSAAPALSTVLVLLRLSSALPNYFMNSPPSPMDCSPNQHRQPQQNYMGHLTSLSLPYLGDVPIPNNMPQIQPSPPKWGGFSVVTKYVSRHPICIRVTSKKPPCKLKNTNKLTNEVTIMKQLNFRTNKMMRAFNNNYDLMMKPVHETEDRLQPDDGIEEDDDLEGSESPRKFNDPAQITPTLRTPPKINEMLVEDRLDRLEELLPHYKRLRTYETSTITVTKTTINHRMTQATLLVKNCIPEGIEFCDNNNNRRKQAGGDQLHTEIDSDDSVMSSLQDAIDLSADSEGEEIIETRIINFTDLRPKTLYSRLGKRRGRPPKAKIDGSSPTKRRERPPKNRQSSESMPPEETIRIVPSTEHKCTLCSKGSLCSHMNFHKYMEEKPESERKSEQKEKETIPEIANNIVENKYSCSKCSSSTFKNAILLTKHIALHDKNYKFECKICKKVFSDSIQLNAHTKIHINSYWSAVALDTQPK